MRNALTHNYLNQHNYYKSNLFSQQHIIMAVKQNTETRCVSVKQLMLGE